MVKCFKEVCCFDSIFCYVFCVLCGYVFFEYWSVCGMSVVLLCYVLVYWKLISVFLEYIGFCGVYVRLILKEIVFFVKRVMVCYFE